MIGIKKCRSKICAIKCRWGDLNFPQPSAQQPGKFQLLHEIAIRAELNLEWNLSLKNQKIYI